MAEGKKLDKKVKKAKITELTPYIEQAKLAHCEDEPRVLVEAILAAMREWGKDEEYLKVQRKLLEAKFGIGDWQDVLVTLQETMLKTKVEHNDVLGQISSLLNLTRTAMNGGHKQKAQHYLSEAEQLLSHTTPQEIEQSLFAPKSVSAETMLQLKRAEIERLRNWLS